MQPKLRHRAQIFTEYVLVLSAALATLCQDVLAQEKTIEGSENIEEIVVYGEKSQVILRSELYGAQEDFFAVFNSLNSRDEFDIECEFLTPLGERRRYHVCAPKFAKKSEAAASTDYMLTLHLAAAQKQAPDFEAARSAAIAHHVQALTKEELMQSEMAMLLSEHPEMREALSKVVTARDKYENSRRKD